MDVEDVKLTSQVGGRKMVIRGMGCDLWGVAHTMGGNPHHSVCSTWCETHGCCCIAMRWACHPGALF